MIKPKVSVLMPIYNTPLEHLKESIESILNQTFSDFEFLIVNDSPENKALDEFVNNFDDTRIHYFKNDKNQGIEFSTNFLIKQAQGDYLAIFDHDDISLPERLEKEVLFLDENPDYGMVSGQFEVFGVENWTSQNPLKNSEIKELLKTTSCVSHTSLMIRAEILRQNKIRYEKKFFPAASYRIITRLATVAKVANLPDVILKYRMDGNNTSLKFADKRAAARAEIQNDYARELRHQNLISTGKFDKVNLIKTDSMSVSDHHYCAEKNGIKFFVKESIHSFDWEFEATSRAFRQDQNHFSEPIEFFEKDGWNYLVLKWEEGENLAKFIKGNQLTSLQKTNFVNNLEEILKALRAANLVHRDIIPRNFMVVGDKLKLVDFYFAVDFNNYQEYDHIKHNITAIVMLGEEYAAGRYYWDDAFSLSKVIEFIKAGKSEIISSFIGERVITPDKQQLGDNIASLREEIIKLRKEIKDLEYIILDKNKYINLLHKEVEDRDETLKSITESKSYQTVEKIKKTYSGIVKRGKDEK